MGLPLSAPPPKRGRLGPGTRVLQRTEGTQGAARPGLSSEVVPSSRIGPSPHAGRLCRETSPFLDVEAARGCERRLAGSTGEHA